VSVLAGLVTRLERAPDPGLLDGFTEEERRAIVRGYGLPRPRRRVVRLTGPSLIAGRVGLSKEAVELFDAARAAGGTLAVSSFGHRARLDDLDRLVDELVHVELCERVEIRPRRRGGVGGPGIAICRGYEDILLVAEGWSRWGG
jgi:hypothetical protein